MATKKVEEKESAEDVIQRLRARFPEVATFLDSEERTRAEKAQLEETLKKGE